MQGMARENDFVTFSGAASLGGNITANVLNAEYQIVTSPVRTHTLLLLQLQPTHQIQAMAGHQLSVRTKYVLESRMKSHFLVGVAAHGVLVYGVQVVFLLKPYVFGVQANFGEDLVFGPRGGDIFYWDATNGVNTRGVYLSSLGGASNVPTSQKNLILVSDINRFVFCFGTNDVGSATVDPMLIRWSDQEDVAQWTPASTNQAGSLRLSRGTEIVAAKQARQEVLVWTNSSLYSLQYQGAPAVWGAQLVGDNISIASQNTVAFASGVAFWMGKDKFYMYDGRSQPLPCNVRRYVFEDF